MSVDSTQRRPDPDPAAGQVLGGFELVEKIGAGGMGEVWRARNVQVPTVVRAVKLIRPQFGQDPAFRERFLREAEYLELLRDPHIMRVDTVGAEGGALYMVMELLQGHSVEHCLGGTSVATACRLVHDAALGVARAHQHHIFHRDLKPSNLFVTEDGVVKVLDFGIARHEGKPGMTLASASQPGTPAYYAPEMVLGKQSSGASDVYALGVTLFELLTGRQPFEPEAGVVGSQAMNFLMFSHVNTPLPDARTNRPEVPEAVQALLVKATDKDPEQRYPDAAALAKALAEHCDVAAPLRLGADVAACQWKDGLRQKLLVALPAAPAVAPRLSYQEAVAAGGTFMPGGPAGHAEPGKTDEPAAGRAGLVFGAVAVGLLGLVALTFSDLGAPAGPRPGGLQPIAQRPPERRRPPEPAAEPPVAAPVAPVATASPDAGPAPKPAAKQPVPGPASGARGTLKVSDLGPQPLQRDTGTLDLKKREGIQVIASYTVTHEGLRLLLTTEPVTAVWLDGDLQGASPRMVTLREGSPLEVSFALQARTHRKLTFTYEPR